MYKQAVEASQVCHNAVSELINESKETSNCCKREGDDLFISSKQYDENEKNIITSEP